MPALHCDLHMRLRPSLQDLPHWLPFDTGLVVDLPNYKTPQVSSKALSGQTTEPAPQGERRSHKMSVGHATPFLLPSSHTSLFHIRTASSPLC